MRRATGTLEQEHRTIERILQVMRVLADELVGNGYIDSDVLGDLCGFLRIYGNQCHHGKGENCLFPALERHGVPEEGCPLGSLRREHERLRALTQELMQASAAYTANPPVGRSILSEVFRKLVQFYSAHIWKEEHLLFPLARTVLSMEEDERLLNGFTSVESDIAPCTRKSYEQLATKIEDRVVKRTPQTTVVAREPLE